MKPANYMDEENWEEELRMFNRANSTRKVVDRILHDEEMMMERDVTEE